jgi:hypothetical protein
MGNKASSLGQIAGDGAVVSKPCVGHWVGGGTGDCVVSRGRSVMDSTIARGAIPGRPDKCAESDRWGANSARSVCLNQPKTQATLRHTSDDRTTC